MHELLKRAEQLGSDFFQAAASLKTALSHHGLRASFQVEELRINWLGKKGHLSLLFEELKSVSKEDKPAVGKALNILKKDAEQAIEQLLQMAEQAELEAALNQKPLDVTLPVSSSSLQGALHPVTLMGHMLLDIFRRYGFTVYDGPEVELDYYNFSALNIPEHHPARDMQDTFFLKDRKNTVLRTHTSNIQIHSMLKEKPPIRLVAPGRVYRVDNDATHSPMFHQIECVVVDEGISFAHMKGLIDAFMKSIFGSSFKTRLRPSYFPFVEPGAEVDLQCTICRGKGCKVCKETGWLEIGGCGMIHPNVFESVQYDSEAYTGFAFGFGIDRMAMLAWELKDLREMFEGSGSYSQMLPVFPPSLAIS